MMRLQPFFSKSHGEPLAGQGTNLVGCKLGMGHSVNERTGGNNGKSAGMGHAVTQSMVRNEWTNSHLPRRRAKANGSFRRQ